MEDQFIKQVLAECQGKKNIFIFISKDDEVDTKPIIKELLKKKLTVIVPLCDPTKNTLLLSEIRNLRNLSSSTYGILVPEKIIAFPKENIDIFFVPGTKFDYQGNRKGRGKGYFDRFLKEIKGKKHIIGLCFEHQILERLEQKPWDVPVDKIIYSKTR